MHSLLIGEIMKKIVFFLMLGLLFLPASAKAFSGEKLLGFCKEVQKYQTNKDDKSVSEFDMGLCYGFISGVVNNHRIMFKYRKMPMIFCTPKNIQIKEIADLYVKYMEANPKNGHINGALLIDSVLKKEYPCPKTIKPIK
jgi:hypothetical protein